MAIDINTPRPGDLEYDLLRKILNRLGTLSGSIGFGPGGANRYVQFNDNGSFGGDVFLTFTGTASERTLSLGAWGWTTDANGSRISNDTEGNKNFQIAGGIHGGSANILLFGESHATAPFQTQFRRGGVINWKISDPGHFLAGTDNTLDIGAAADNRPRNLFVAGTTASLLFKTTTPLVALGGGSAATLGTIGGTGPATAGQNTWLKMTDSTGATFWVPAWK